MRHTDTALYTMKHAQLSDADAEEILDEAHALMVAIGQNRGTVWLIANKQGQGRWDISWDYPFDATRISAINLPDDANRLEVLDELTAAMVTWREGDLEDAWWDSAEEYDD